MFTFLNEVRSTYQYISIRVSCFLPGHEGVEGEIRVWEILRVLDTPLSPKGAPALQGTLEGALKSNVSQYHTKHVQ